MKRKSIILSAVTCFVSFCLLVLGAFAIADPSVQLVGKVSYQTHDAKVLVLGKVNGFVDTDESMVSVDYLPITDKFNPTENQQYVGRQYLSYTSGEGVDNTNDDLKDWEIGDIKFFENADGIKPITISFQVTNLSKYSISAVISFEGLKDESDLTTNYLQRSIKGITNNKVFLEPNCTSEFSITYKVTDKTKNVSGNNFLGMSISFERDFATTEGWEIIADDETMTCTISKYTGTEKNVICPSQITKDGKTYTVTTIGNNERISTYNDQINSFAIPNTVTRISNYAFLNCRAMDHIDIPDSVEFIGNEACYGMSIKSATLSDSMDTLYSAIFMNCQNLVQVTLPKQLKTIVAYAFYGCSSLQEIELPDSVTTMGRQVFYNCKSLKNVTISSGLSAISDRTFSGCSNLQEIELPENVTSLDWDAFAYCSSLKKIVIPNSITWIDETTFNYCSESLEVVKIGEQNQRYSCGNGSNCIVEISTGKLILGCDNTILPTDIEIISITDTAFYHCQNLTEITIPSTVTSIGVDSFSGCPAMASITFLGTTPPTVDSSAFTYCTNLTTIYVQSGYESVYTTAFASIETLKDCSVLTIA